MKKALNIPKEEKKNLIKKIEEFTGSQAKYLGVPTFDYQIGSFLVHKDCSIECEDPAMLESFYFCYCLNDTANSVIIPVEKTNPANLINILAAKQNLITKALGIESVDIVFRDDMVVFPWFKDLSPEEAHAYIAFIEAVCRMSLEQTRTSAKVKEVENEKYAFRCFLLRLGFIGDEFKNDRKVLLRNLEGSPAWKNKEVQA